MADKNMFPLENFELTLAKIELDYLNFVCQKALLNQNDMLRQLIREINEEGILSFKEWYREAHKQQPELISSNAVNENPADVTQEENNDKAIKTIVESDPLIALPTIEQAKIAIAGGSTETPNGSKKRGRPAKARVEQASPKKIETKRTKKVQVLEVKKSRATPKKESNPEPSTKDKFDPTAIDSKFDGMSFEDIIEKLLKKDPQRSWTVDELIQEIYGDVSKEKMGGARVSVGRAMAGNHHGGAWKRTAINKPATYQFAP